MPYSAERRLVIVENPRSSAASNIEHEVFDRLDAQNVRYERVTMRYPNATANILDLAETLKSGDMVISAAGDGTASQVANATLLSAEDIEIGFLPYGNFNDIARAHTRLGSTVLDLLHAEAITTIPLTIMNDGEHWRYAPAYATVGWSALATQVFSHDISRYITRNTLPPLKLGASLLQIVYRYYRDRSYTLPDFTAHDTSEIHTGLTDIIAINNPAVASSIGSRRKWYDTEEFGYRELDVSHFFPNLVFGLQSLARQMPLSSKERVDIRFHEPVTIPIQTEGEFHYLSTTELTIKKDPIRKLRVLHSRSL